MDLSLSTQLKQEQNLSPQMLQSLALLPLPVMELKTYIEKEIEGNPAFEIPETEFKDQNIQDENNRDSVDVESDDYDYDFDSYDTEAADRKAQMIENSSNLGESLSEHLLKQLGLCNISEEEYKIGEMLIGNLDANGFYIVPIKTLFEHNNFKEEQINAAVSLVRTFDPYGVCVQDFRESLIVQAQCSGMNADDLKIYSLMVNNHLEALKNGKFREVAYLLHISEEDLNTFYSILKSFTPYPGRNYDSNADSYAVPEFSIHNVNGSLVLEMNKGDLPELKLSEDFSNLAKDLKGPDAKEAASYISSNIRQAKNLISQLDLRYKTMYNAANAIMELQKEFFFSGPKFLKALSLKEAADKIGVHETTMGRLSQSKWIDTDWGMLPMKYFFSQGVGTTETSGSAVSRNAVKDIIGDILKENNKLSDQKISDLLLERGIKCARRTVSKYRSELNIDSSFHRH